MGTRQGAGGAAGAGLKADTQLSSPSVAEVKLKLELDEKVS